MVRSRAILIVSAALVSFIAHPSIAQQVDCSGTARTTTMAATAAFARIPKTSTTAEYYVDNSYLAIDPIKYQDKWAAAELVFTGATYKYDVRLTTMQEDDGESQYRLFVNGIQVAQFTNPRCKCNSAYTTTWPLITIPKNAKLRMESRPHSNKLKPEAGAPGGYAWSRGRWSKLELGPKAKADICMGIAVRGYASPVDSSTSTQQSGMRDLTGRQIVGGGSKCSGLAVQRRGRGSVRLLISPGVDGKHFHAR